MREEFFQIKEIHKLEIEFWNQAMVRASHATYTDRFHELARLVPHLKAGILTDEATKNGSLKKNPEKRWNSGEPSRDMNVKDDNKRTRTGNDFATTTNPIRREYTGAAPKIVEVVPMIVNLVNTRNPTIAHRACFKCGSTDHFKSACPRLNQAQRPRGNHLNQVVVLENRIYNLRIRITMILKLCMAVYTDFSISRFLDCNPLNSGIFSLQQGELSSLTVGTSSGSGNLSLAVGMCCAFYSQQSFPKLDAPSAIKFPE
nr:reverse transcriptase domain-containing protein [Tanacetum cinerariifolium]